MYSDVKSEFGGLPGHETGSSRHENRDERMENVMLFNWLQTSMGKRRAKAAESIPTSVMEELSRLDKELRKDDVVGPEEIVRFREFAEKKISELNANLSPGGIKIKMRDFFLRRMLSKIDDDHHLDSEKSYDHHDHRRRNDTQQVDEQEDEPQKTKGRKMRRPPPLWRIIPEMIPQYGRWPNLRLTGVRINVGVDCRREDMMILEKPLAWLDSWLGTSLVRDKEPRCTLDISTEPGFVSGDRVVSDGYSVREATGVVQHQIENGIRIALTMKGKFAYFDTTQLTSVITSAVVFFGLPSMIIMLVVFYCMGLLSSIYRNAAEQHFSLRDEIQGRATKMLVAKKMYERLVREQDAADKGIRGGERRTSLRYRHSAAERSSPAGQPGGGRASRRADSDEEGELLPEEESGLRRRPTMRKTAERLQEIELTGKRLRVGQLEKEIREVGSYV